MLGRLTSCMLFLLACQTDTLPKHGQSDTAVDTAATIAEGCRADPGDPDKDREVVLSFPYDARGRQADLWGTWALSADGNLNPSSTRFSMGRSTMAEVVFTPDGRLALVPQEDGSIGIISEDGVVDMGLEGIYAERIVMEPSGEQAWAIDGNWQENGGGIYPLSIACDSPTVTLGERWLEAKLPADMLLLGDQRVVIGREVPGSAEGDDLALVDASGAFLAGADAFGDDDAVVTDAVLSRDGRYVLIADNSEFSGVPTRVAVVEIEGDALIPRQVINIEDPVGLFVAPDDGRVVVVSGYANALFVLDRTDALDAPYQLGGEPDYLGSSPQLPGSAALVMRGSLKGRLLVAEVEGVRQVDIEGGVVDRGLVPSEGSMEAIVGAIGVQP